MATTPIIEQSSVIAVRDVTKVFRGGRRALDGVTLDVPAGTCFGFLGPNGAGKTTLIRIVLGLMRATSGTVVVRGHEVPREARTAMARVGGIVEEPRFYPYLSGRENLVLWARVMGPAAIGRVPGALARVALAGRADERVGRYSMGMRQRLGVARALLSDPEVLVLDEPSNGLDPEGIAEFRALIRSFVDEGRTVFISSHLLDEIQKICDHVAIVREGRVIAQGPVAEVVAAGRGGMRIGCDDPGRAAQLLQDRGDLGEIELDGSGLVIGGPADPASRATVVRRLVEAGVAVDAVQPVGASLEERFLELMGDAAAPPPSPHAEPPPPPPPPRAA